ncbi:Glycoside hydrolase, 38 vacuolar alpha mannosidase [Rhizina undulata]
MGGGSQQVETSYPKLNFSPKGQQIRSIYQDRLKQFTATGQYESKNLRSMFTKDQEDGIKYVELESYSVPDLKRISFEEAIKGDYSPTSKGELFGPSWSTHWFRIHLTVPDRMLKQERLEFYWDSNCEGLVWSEDGEPLQGLTGGGERVAWLFPDAWRDGEKHLFYVEIGCNGMFGNPTGGDTIQPPDPNRYFSLSKADIVAPNLEAVALYIDFWIIGDASREFPEDSWEAHTATQVANEIINAFVQGDQESILKCRKIAQRYLGKHVDSAKVYDSSNAPLVFATGHCHIDTCWLWPFDETKRKVARSWSSQCNLMDEYPEHRFTCSSAQQYKWLEKYYPKLFTRVRENVKKGKFQYIGGSWVEHDTNMPSGESLVRQFILGQRYFESRFGERCQTFWLPDTFGYSSQLPQLCRLAGMSRFMTQKLSWNNINKFPHTTFNWVALDGSQVLCHMPPSETYTAMAHFGDVKRSITQHKSMDQDSTSLLVFGYGDGGGGPTAEQLEKLRRCRGLSDTTGLLPRVKMGDSVDDFFARIERKIEEGKDLVTWYGELYFELHRGTYTTQSNNKKNNRQAEVLMRDVETLASWASLRGSDDYKYPKKDIDEMWEIICLCQFHDCLPGSSIEMVYRDSDALYADVFERGQKLLEDASQALGLYPNPRESSIPYAINTLPWARSEVVKLPKYAFDGVFPQNEVHGYGGYGILSSEGPGLATCVEEISARVSVEEVAQDVFVLANDNIKVTVQGGNITSLFDRKLNREVIPKGRKANQLVIMDDKPLYWQAWDVELYHLETRKELPQGQVSILDKGPLRASLLVKNKISETSWMETTISLQAAINGAGSYVEFENEIEWREDMRFLKVEFPVDVHNTEASYETQYGIVRRPTHYNTSWDMAKFEVCCHKWADLSEHGFGVAILNDCKYGFATVGNVMRLSLIRAPKAPDAHADMGRHKFRYAILPHAGSVNETVVRTAAAFNNPMRLAYTETSKVAEITDLLSTVTLSGSESIILDAVKRGEDDEDVTTGGFPTRTGKSLILRFYDSLGGKSSTTIHTVLPVKKIWKTNLLEDDLEVVETQLVEINGKKVTTATVVLRPFEVATYRLQL